MLASKANRVIGNDVIGRTVDRTPLSAMGGNRTLPLYGYRVAGVPKFKLSRLRDIGWNEWNPISLNRTESAEDEYDSYLLGAAGRLWNGDSEEAVASYLADIEANHMGLGHGFGIKLRALATAKAIREYAESLRT